MVANKEIFILILIFPKALKSFIPLLNDYRQQDTKS